MTLTVCSKDYQVLNHVMLSEFMLKMQGLPHLPLKTIPMCFLSLPPLPVATILSLTREEVSVVVNCACWLILYQGLMSLILVGCPPHPLIMEVVSLYFKKLKVQYWALI